MTRSNQTRSRARRWVGLGAALATIILIAGCSDQSAPKAKTPVPDQPKKVVSAPAILRGIAARCAGPVTVAQLKVTVRVYRAGRVPPHKRDQQSVTSQNPPPFAKQTTWLKRGDRYKFRLPAGVYDAIAIGSADGWKTVHLHAGKTTILNFPNYCM
jgi:hypothetical protein